MELITTQRLAMAQQAVIPPITKTTVNKGQEGSLVELSPVRHFSGILQGHPMHPPLILKIRLG
jgi:hypothetical protein